MNKIYIISGPSGVGKGTLVKSLVENDDLNLEWGKTATTRKPRKDDPEGAKHIYLSKQKFEDKIRAGELAEKNFYNENYYGTPKSEIEKTKSNLVFEIDVNGGLNIKKLYPDKTVLIFITAPIADIKKRLEDRKTNTPEEINQRLKIAQVELEKAKNYDYHVENPQGHPEQATKELEKIIKIT